MSAPSNRPFREKLRDIEDNPENWQPISAHSEKAIRKKARRQGTSIQTVYRHVKTGETIYRHVVTDDQGRVVDDHYRPHYEPRKDEI